MNLKVHYPVHKTSLLVPIVSQTNHLTEMQTEENKNNVVAMNNILVLLVLVYYIMVSLKK
jgi:hypothetical protein